jgi:hypothetical protein
MTPALTDIVALTVRAQSGLAPGSADADGARVREMIAAVDRVVVAAGAYEHEMRRQRNAWHERRELLDAVDALRKVGGLP